MLRSEMMARIDPEEFLDEMAVALIDAEDRQKLHASIDTPKTNGKSAQQTSEQMVSMLKLLSRGVPPKAARA